MYSKENWVEVNENVYKATLKLSCLCFIINGVLVLIAYLINIDYNDSLFIVITLVMLLDGLIGMIVATIFYNSKLEMD